MKGESERVQFAHHYPVAVFGGGVSGRAAARLARSLGAEVQVYDQRKGSVFGHEEVERTGLVVTSPGFRVPFLVWANHCSDWFERQNYGDRVSDESLA